MGRLYDSKKEACAKCRNGEETQIDKKTGKYHNVRSSPKKTNKSSGKLTADDLLPIKHKWGSK
jgi:hypothetical protein